MTNTSCYYLTVHNRHSRQAKTVAKNLSLHQAIEEKLNKDEESEAVKQASKYSKQQSFNSEY